MRVPRFGSLLAGAALLLVTPSAHAQPRVTETDLVSDIEGRALHTDSHLVNPWGIAGRTFIWVSDNGTGVSTLYRADGTANPLVVTIPGGKPTGVVIGSTQEPLFTFANGDTAFFIFATENGTIAAWSPRLADPTAAVEVAGPGGGIFKGLAVGQGTEGALLFVANFHSGAIDVFDRHFAPTTVAGSFTDPDLPSGYGPFNVAAIGGELFVAYAQQDEAKEDEIAGPGLGYVDVFGFDGSFKRRLVSQGALDAPWAMVRAPSGWAGLPEALLVGNFGDGRINAFDPGTGNLIAALQDSLGNPLSINGLWGLQFGAAPEIAQRLFFAAGIQDEAHGLFGYVAPVRPAVECGNVTPHGLQFWARSCGVRGGGHGLGSAPGLRKLAPDDELANLLECVRGSSQAFGSGGCFQAGCDLLVKRGRRSAREHAAQQLLALMLNRCSGALCDTTRLRCGEDEGEDEGHDGGDGHDGHGGDHGHPSPIATVADLIARLDSGVCGGVSDPELHRLAGLAACANSGGGEEDSDHDEDALGGAGAPLGLLAQALINPARLSGTGTRFALSTQAPATVGLRIYDASGRLVAEPLREAPLSGQMVVSWNGRDLRGVRVAPGTYFFRARAGGEVSGGRFVLIH